MTATRTIARPAEKLFEFFADASNHPAWQKGMQSCEWITEPPIARIAVSPARPIRRASHHLRVRGHRIRAGSAHSNRDRRGHLPDSGQQNLDLDGEDQWILRASITRGPKVLWPFSVLARRLAQGSIDVDYDRLQALLEA